MSKNWKKYERRICKSLGGDRRGADVGGKDGGKNDCKDTEYYSVEAKIWKAPYFSVILSDCRKAEERQACIKQIPIAVTKKVGDRYDDAIVSMRWETFLRYFGPGGLYDPKDIDDERFA